MTTLTPLAEIAAAEERRIAMGVGEVALEARPFAGGTAARGAPGNWTNGIYGAGMSSDVDAGELRETIEWYERAGVEPRIECCPFAHRSLVAGAAEEGFVVRSFEQVFFRALFDASTVRAPAPAPAELRIEPVDPQDDAMVDAYAQTALAGFLPVGADIPADWLEVSRRVARHPRTTAIVARLDEEIVGAAAFEVLDTIGALFGAMVVERHRRRGIQQALLAWRLRRAAEHGARWATIGGRPGEATERNVRRMGFQVAYTKAILVRRGAGLAPVAE